MTCRSPDEVSPAAVCRVLPLRRSKSCRSRRSPGRCPVTNPLQSLPGRISTGSFGRIRTVAAPRLNSRSGRFKINFPAYSDVGNAHVAAGRQAHSDRLVMADSSLLHRTISRASWATPWLSMSNGRYRHKRHSRAGSPGCQIALHADRG